MANDEAYLEAERKIEGARRSGAKKLDLSVGFEEKRRKLTVLPEALCKLRQLRSLNLSGNELTSLPDLSQLSQLDSLDLSRNKLLLLPEWVGQLTQLQSLILSSNQLSELPVRVSQLRQLGVLSLANNQFAVIPECLLLLPHLNSLNLSGNHLSALPEWLGQLRHVHTLDISHNDLPNVPVTLSQLKRIQSLELSYNNLTELPAEFGALTELLNLDLSRNKLSSLPPSFSKFKNLKRLNLFSNKFKLLPEWLGELTALETLATGNNRISALPDSLRNCKRLKWLDIGDAAGGSPLRELPVFIRELPSLQALVAHFCDLESLPFWLGELSTLEELKLDNNRISDLPGSLAHLQQLTSLSLQDNPLIPELSAAYKEGVNAVKRYLRAKATAQVALNEAKLILVGEGEVGKSCLLAALRDEPWIDSNPTTHGIEIKPVKVTNRNVRGGITLNGWDFGGQRVYRPTHQLFFSAPAVYLVVWKPREGPQQGFVKEWISLVKHRSPEAKIIVIATHGGPKQRQPDIDRQEIWDLFGKDMVVDFLLVDSKPDKKGKRKGIADLKKAIARVAVNLPEMGRKVPQRWEETRQALKKNGAAYLPLPEVERLCLDHKMDADEAKDFIRISHRLGHLIHYEHDPILQNIVVLKPDWLSTAISFVLDDEQTRKGHGLVSSERLAQLWDDQKRKDRYPKELHPIFLGLMERYDLSYRVPDAGKVQTNETSLIAQLVPDVRPPEHEFKAGWSPGLSRGDEQQSQICRIVDAKSGQSATAEGLFYQLIVRLHKYSLGRANRDLSLHWQRGLVLDDDYNGRALLENVGNDVRITVRAAYPERFLSVLTHEVKWLVENFWKGLRCEVTVPCMTPCGMDAPGTGLFEVEKLIAFKKQEMQKFPCYVSGCSQAQDIESLLRNAPAARRPAVETFLADNFDEMRLRLDAVRDQLNRQDHQALDQFHVLDQNDRRILSRIEDAYTSLMQSLIDEVKDGPRLFGFEPVDRSFFSRPKWISAKFRLTLWCEHSRLPLPVLNGKGDSRGVYELDLPRDWVVKAAPYLKLVTGLLSLVVPVAGSAMKLELDDAAYKGIEKQLEFGQKSLESALRGTEKAEDWATNGDAPGLEEGNSIRAQGAVLRQLHAWLKEKDPSFGGLVRVQNRRQEFLWVHPNFESEY